MNITFLDGSIWTILILKNSGHPSNSSFFPSPQVEQSLPNQSIWRFLVQILMIFPLILTRRFLKICYTIWKKNSEKMVSIIQVTVILVIIMFATFFVMLLIFVNVKSVTNILNLSPHFVSNIRHQHRCHDNTFVKKSKLLVNCKQLVIQSSKATVDIRRYD